MRNGFFTHRIHQRLDNLVWKWADSQQALESRKQECQQYQEQYGHDFTTWMEWKRVCFYCFLLIILLKTIVFSPLLKIQILEKDFLNILACFILPTVQLRGRAGDQSSHYSSNRLQLVGMENFSKANQIPGRKWTLDNQKTKILSAVNGSQSKAGNMAKQSFAEKLDYGLSLIMSIKNRGYKERQVQGPQY